MSDLSIRAVASEADLQAFLRLPWTVYKNDKSWTPPLWSEHVRFFDPHHNVELEHIDFEKFVAWRGSTPVGTIIAHVNHAYNDFQGQNAGWFGQFEILDDKEAAHGLLKTAEEWVKARGMDKLMGPATFSTNSEIGLLVDGYEHPQMVLTSHAPRYSKDIVESYPGLKKAMDLWCWYFNGNTWGGKKVDNPPEKLVRVAKKVMERRNFKVCRVNMADFKSEVEKVKVIYNQAWAKNWGFIPMNDAEINKIAKDLKDMIDPDIARFVEVDGKPVAFGLPIPNIYEPLRMAGCKPGEPELIQLLRLIWHWKILRRVKGARVWALGVLEEYRASGVEAVMLYDMMLTGLPKGYVDVEMSWILENNQKMNSVIESIGAEIYKTYRVYEKAL
jgi:hypothetical protein